jgi:hypothetical protein
MDALSGLKRISVFLFAQMMSCYPLFANSIFFPKPESCFDMQKNKYLIVTLVSGKEGGDICKKNSTYFETSGGC